MSTAFHPQSDGQSESANRVIIMYLRCLTGDRPRDWLRWLPWAEYVFSTAFQSSLRETPFRVVYGRDPPSIRSYEPGETRVAAVAKTMEERAEFLEDIRLRLEQAQAVQKRHYDRAHRSVHFQVGDWVLLRLWRRAAASLPQAASGKLKPRFYGPYRVVELINNVAARLALPPQARLHDVFHVGLLKKFHGDPPQAPPPLPAVRHGAVVPEPERAVKARLARGVRQVLIQWKGASPASATWEDVDTIRSKFPQFQLEDELPLEEGRDVIYDYSGYGQSSGKPSEHNTYADIEAAYKCLIENFGAKEEEIILYGQSVGSGPTVDLASRLTRLRAVVLHSPILSGLRVMYPVKRTYWFDIYKNIDKIPQVTSPVLIIHV
ncbi:hypothetical protein U9M48_036140 [Paspalum notatum var. saurae]|uniref:Chromo domain-containing protein n=1 Tax=Paspalum notatum var. saurae TaxID=547442 RepID=A0AAQ3UDG7_PASNO